MMRKTTATIIENREIAPGVYRLALADACGAGFVAEAVTDAGGSGPVAIAADDGAAMTADDGVAGFGVAAIAAAAAPGQFANIYLNNDALLLPRPLGISDVESVWDKGRLRGSFGESIGREPQSRGSFDVTSGGEPRLVFVYAVVGEGTAELASYAPGTEIRILGPQGNGYDLAAAGRRVLLIGGGLGIPPLLFAARRLREGAGPDGEVKITALLGYRDEPYYSEEMRRYCDEVFDISELWESRESGEARGRPERDSGAGPERCAHKTRHGGVRSLRGTVMDLIARLEEDGALDLAGTSVLACGPLPMLRAVSEWAAARGVPAQVSLEERMGCGYGACVGCTITVKAEGAGTGLHNVASVAEACGPQVAEISEGQVDEISSGQSTSTSSKRNIATCGLVRRKVCKDGPVFPSDVIVW